MRKEFKYDEFVSPQQVTAFVNGNETVEPISVVPVEHYSGLGDITHTYYGLFYYENKPENNDATNG